MRSAGSGAGVRRRAAPNRRRRRQGVHALHRGRCDPSCPGRDPPSTERDRADWPPSAGIRLRRDLDPYPVGIFPSLDERYAEIEHRCPRYPFGHGDAVLPFLSAEDLALFKLSFGRDKGWVDLRAMARARPALDIDYIERRLIGLRGRSMYPRVVRLRIRCCALSQALLMRCERCDPGE